MRVRTQNEVRRNGRSVGVALCLVLLGAGLLSACGGKEKALRPGQEVRAVPTPEVAKGTPVTVAWRTSVGGSNIQQPISLTPAFFGTAAFLANSKGSMVRVDLDGGSIDWRRDIDTDLVAAVGVDKAIAAVATSDGELVAINTADGSQLWRQSLGVAISAPPVIGQDRAIVRTTDGQVIALKATTGDNVWAYQRPISSLSMAGDAPPLLAGEGLVSGFSNGRVVASSVFTGQVFWEKRQFRPTGNNLVARLIDIDAEPTLVGQYILVGAYQGGIAALRLRDGQEVWRSPVSSRQKISFDPSGVYATGDDGAVHKLDLDTGKSIWTQAGLRGHGVSNPVVHEGSVYVGDIDGQLYSLDQADGSFTGRANVLSGLTTSLHLHEGAVYAYSAQSGQLAALR